MTQHNVAQVFIDAVHRTPAATALIKDGRRISYRDLLAEVEATAAMYQASGIQQGDRLLVFVPMSIDLYRIVLALFYIGAIPVFLDAWVKPARLLECLKAVPCKGLIAPRKLLWLAWLISPLRKLAKKIAAEKRRGGAVIPSVCETAANDTALITFTTGSTGTPKAADRTHQFLSAQLEALSPLLPGDTATTLTMLPIVVLIQLAMNRTTVLPPKKYSAKRADSFSYLHKTLQHERVALFITSPAAASRLCRYAKVDSLKYIITGGGPISPELPALLSFVYPGAGKLALYGSTEAEPIAHLDMQYWSSRPYHSGPSDGLALGTIDSHASVTIIPVTDGPVAVNDLQAWESLHLGSNSIGEIVVSGPHVLQHYINNPEAERLNKIWVEDTVWHRTGDAGRLDENGMLHFYGRCSEIIVHDGRHIYPVLVDDYLRRMIGTAYTAVLFIKDRLTVVIEKGPHYTAEGLAACLDEAGLGDAHVIYLKVLPKDPRHQSKIDYAKLRTMLAD